MNTYNAENHALNLPDKYRKTSNSNNAKILEIERLEGVKIREALSQVEAILDIYNATGKTLDLYGEMVGQVRGQATDEQYRMLIKTKIMRNLSNGSHKSIVDSLAAILNCSPSQISIKDTSNKVCSVTIANIPLEIVLYAGLSTSQLDMLIKSLLPVGVTFEPFTYEGTFSFAASEGEQSETEGFTDVEGGTIGGYLGTLSNNADDIVLPI